MTNQPFTADEWRNIWQGFKDSPEHQMGIEILRMPIVEIDKDILLRDSCWYKHFKRSPNAYFP